MKKLLLGLAVAGALYACDSSWDLSKVSTDDTTIGSDQSVFTMPLATLKIDISELNTKGTRAVSDDNIRAIFDEVDIWLATVLPDGQNYIDIKLLADETSLYLGNLIEQLYNEMRTNANKRKAVADLVWEKYKYDVKDYVDISTAESFIRDFDDKIAAQMPELEAQIRTIAREYLKNVDNIDDIVYNVDDFELDKDVVDMLTKNIDPADKANPKNMLYIYGTIHSELPIGLEVTPVFEGTNIIFDPIRIEPNEDVEIGEVRIFAEDLQRVISGVKIVIPVGLLKYYPQQKFQDGQLITLTLKVKKVGGLKL